jgi:hypothetical protein
MAQAALTSKLRVSFLKPELVSRPYMVERSNTVLGRKLTASSRPLPVSAGRPC